MRKKSTLLALCALAAAAGRAAEAEPPSEKAELNKLKGTWKVTKLLAGDGFTSPSREASYRFDGDKLTRMTFRRFPRERGRRGRGGGNWPLRVTYKVKIDTKKQPHTIELTPERGRIPGSGRWGLTQTGIYKIEKGELYLALGRPRKVPKDFKGEAGEVYVMTREKDKEKAKEKPKE
jgi:uncharacterized protein (TIGR03067 family)